MRKIKTLLGPFTFAAAVAVALFLCILLGWLLSVSEFAPNRCSPSLTISARYQSFVVDILPTVALAVLGFLIACKILWKRNRLLCSTLGCVVLHLLLVMHIVFVLINCVFPQ